MESLKEIFQVFVLIDGVKGAILTDSDGFIVEKTFNMLEEMPNLDAFLRDMLLVTNDVSAGFIQEDFVQSYIEFSDFNLTCVRLAQDFLLTIIGGAGVNLGRIRLEVKKTKKLIESIVLP